mgnify:CR=1 FL=1
MVYPAGKYRGIYRICTFIDKIKISVIAFVELCIDECFKHWQNNIDKEHRSAVDNMIHEMTESNNVMQVEYSWHHPKKDVIIVRSSGRCVEKNDEVIVFEGFHRVLGDL